MCRRAIFLRKFIAKPVGFRKYFGLTICQTLVHAAVPLVTDINDSWARSLGWGESLFL